MTRTVSTPMMLHSAERPNRRCRGEEIKVPEMRVRAAATKKRPQRKTQTKPQHLSRDIPLSSISCKTFADVSPFVKIDEEFKLSDVKRSDVIKPVRLNDMVEESKLQKTVPKLPSSKVIKKPVRRTKQKPSRAID